MRFARFLPFLAILAACAGPVPVGPVPPPRPVPVDPVPPTPTPKPVPADRVSRGEDAALVAIGMSAQNLLATMKVVPMYDASQDDGTRLIEYAIVDVDGKPKSLVVHLNGNLVIGRVRIPRAVANDPKWINDAAVLAVPPIGVES